MIQFALSKFELPLILHSDARQHLIWPCDVTLKTPEDLPMFHYSVPVHVHLCIGRTRLSYTRGMPEKWELIQATFSQFTQTLSVVSHVRHTHFNGFNNVALMVFDIFDTCLQLSILQFDEFEMSPTSVQCAARRAANRHGRIFVCGG